MDFNQPWEAYKDGFGDPKGGCFQPTQGMGEEGAEEMCPSHPAASPALGEFWLGLEKVHRIMGDRGSRLAVQLQDWEGNAESLQFPVHLGGEDTAYSLQLTAPVASKLGATIDTPSGLSLPFSTWDQDHDLRGDKNCAKILSGEQALSLPALPLTLPFATSWRGLPSQPFCIPALPSTPSLPSPLFFFFCLFRAIPEA